MSLDLLDICARQCGAKCCRQVGSNRPVIILSPKEGDTLMRLAATKRVGLILRPVARRDTPSQQTGWHAMDMHDQSGRRCPFLGRNNECEIYELRPEACRRFPRERISWCPLSHALSSAQWAQGVITSV